VGRFGFSPGANPGELLAGAEIRPSPSVAVDAAVGHGLTNGAGATDLRLVAGIRLQRTPAPPPPPPIPRVVDDFTALPEAEDPEEEAVEAPPPEPEWMASQLARVGRGQVELRDPIQFYAGTAGIVPESLPILEQVAQILATTPEIVHVVIVGHASSEGSYAVNYQLSLARAVAVYERLLASGVHPDRLSVRAMGEVTVGPPGAGGDEEQSLARRVEFRITRALGVGEPPPAYDPVELLPFNGAPRPAPESP
jgi:outer membrane protein OmpA-like peptidoglycan-associated protein